MKKQTLLTIFISISLISLISLVSAQYYGGYGSYSGGYYTGIVPSELLENEWVIFGGVFLLTFALVYMALARAFHPQDNRNMLEIMAGMKERTSNQGPIVMISLIIALFVAGAFARRDYLYGWLGADIGQWILTFAMIVGIAIILLLGYRLGGLIGSVAALIIIIITTTIVGIDISFLPTEILDFIGPLIGFVLQGGLIIGIFGVIVVGILYILYRFGGMGGNNIIGRLFRPRGLRVAGARPIPVNQ
jgi:hypothetical protein